MRVGITGASGLIGRRLVQALMDRGDDVTALSRNPEVAALEDRDAVVHLAGEPVAQRWSAAAKQRIRDSRELGTRNLVAGLAACGDTRPSTLVSASAVGYYGPHGDELVTEQTPPGSDFLAGVCVAWEREALAASELGIRVALVRTGVVLDADGGALEKMLPPFKLGAGGPVAGGRQYMPWIHLDDVVGIYLAALDNESWTGPVNASAPEPVTNRAFSKALGRVLHRPAIAPVPAFAIKLLYGEMSEIVTTGQRAVPERTLELGYSFAFPDLEPALAKALGKELRH